MKTAAPLLRFFGAARARRALGSLPLSALLLLIGCNMDPPPPSKPALTHGSAPGHDGESSNSGLPAGHPAIPAPAPDPLASVEAEFLADAGAPRATPPAQKWNANCLVNRKCPKEPVPIPNCAPGVVAEEWGQLSYTADKHQGQMVVVEGPFALTPATPPGTQKCPPGVCCHSLNMNVVIDGRPEAVGLAGFSCHGDDSTMCCNVPANGQMVNARGKIQRAPAASGLKWQLTGATFCIPVPATKPQPEAGTTDNPR